MPTVRFRDREFDCTAGAVLRDVLLDAGETPHNGGSRALNCRGHGSCGTCAVAVTGAVSEPTRRERLRLRVPPHDPDSGLRLACQTRVLGDVRVEKHDGFWGQHTGPETEPAANNGDGDDDGGGGRVSESEDER